MGTPPQQFTLMIDTGSGKIIIAMEGKQCAKSFNKSFNSSKS